MQFLRMHHFKYDKTISYIIFQENVKDGMFHLAMWPQALEEQVNLNYVKIITEHVFSNSSVKKDNNAQLSMGNTFII